MAKIKTTVEVEEPFIDGYLRLTKRYGVKTVVAAGVVLLDQLEPEERERVIDEVTSTGVSGQEEEGTVPITVLHIERKKRQFFERIVESVTESADLPSPLKQKIQEDLKEGRRELSQQIQNIRQDKRAKGA